ncbi:MAG: hypothetical protein HQK97_04535 [Nitrospirae bacterium]|nr:hypothetical protein [Nitrospirota bacterium]
MSTTTDRIWQPETDNCEECGSWGGYVEHGFDGNGDPKVICPVCNGTGAVPLGAVSSYQYQR